MYEALALICVGLTIAGFVIKNGTLLLSSGLAWIGWGVLMVNVGTGAGEPFEGNVFLPQFFLALGGVLALVCFVSALGMFMSERKQGPPPEGEQESYKRKVMNMTRRR